MGIELLGSAANDQYIMHVGLDQPVLRRRHRPSTDSKKPFRRCRAESTLRVTIMIT